MLNVRGEEPIEYIDFSTDDCYFMHKQENVPLVVYDITDISEVTEIDPELVEFEHIWI